MKRTYHTNILIKYKLGILDVQTVKNIPKSTLYNWRHKDFSGIFGLPGIDNSEIDIMREFLTRKNLLQAAKALYYIYLTFQSVVNRVKNSKKLFFESKELITDTIDRTKDILGFDRVLKVFDITSQTYYYWKNKLKCPVSFLNLCKIRHPLQLTNMEIASMSLFRKPVRRIYLQKSNMFNVLFSGN